MTRYCPPIRGHWRTENGIRLRVDFGDAGAALFHTSCQMHGIPCASIHADPPPAVPLAVAELVQRATALAAYPDRAAPLWAEARRLVAEQMRERVAERQFMQAAE